MKKIITTPNAPAPIGPYNQAVLSGNTLYTSGQIAIHPETGALVLDENPPCPPGTLDNGFFG